MIYNSLGDIADKFEIFLFDAFGVFWEGNGFYPGSTEMMADLLKSGKKVVIVSNSSEDRDNTIKFYERKGLVCGKHYDYMITSGNLLCETIKAGKISFKYCTNPRKYFVIGRPHKEFADSIYEEVKNPQDADFIFCGTPTIFADDLPKYPEYDKLFWPARTDENGKIYAWDTETAKPFENMVAELSKLNKPVLNANPDFTAKVGHELVPGSEAVFVIRNGTITEMFRKNGVEVYEFGKPYTNIYDYTFKILQENGISVNKSKTCMVGDTVRTDVKGAVNYGITPILCMNTGVTAKAILNGESLESICNKEKIGIEQIVQIKCIADIK